ncbi:unnamed protein product [Caenorhabditis bovis]|uniref:Uncharacterized protein n=1 Tax=Caenorhabditis bovis TaxID=2654633 RepID=A0A8S1F380_9PELO|nr:unnamed protein product [Caenorhabditis bovis]
MNADEKSADEADREQLKDGHPPKPPRAIDYAENKEEATPTLEQSVTISQETVIEKNEPSGDQSDRVSHKTIPETGTTSRKSSTDEKRSNKLVIRLTLGESKTNLNELDDAEEWIGILVSHTQGSEYLGWRVRRTGANELCRIIVENCSCCNANYLGKWIKCNVKSEPEGKYTSSGEIQVLPNMFQCRINQKMVELKVDATYRKTDVLTGQQQFFNDVFGNIKGINRHIDTFKNPTMIWIYLNRRTMDWKISSYQDDLLPVAHKSVVGVVKFSNGDSYYVGVKGMKDVRLLKTHCAPYVDWIGKSVAFLAIFDEKSDELVSFGDCVEIQTRKNDEEIEVLVDLEFEKLDENDTNVYRNPEIGRIIDPHRKLAKDQKSAWIIQHFDDSSSIKWRTASNQNLAENRVSLSESATKRIENEENVPQVTGFVAYWLGNSRYLIWNADLKNLQNIRIENEQNYLGKWINFDLPSPEDQTEQLNVTGEVRILPDVFQHRFDLNSAEIRVDVTFCKTDILTESPIFLNAVFGYIKGKNQQLDVEKLPGMAWIFLDYKTKEWRICEFQTDKRPLKLVGLVVRESNDESYEVEVEGLSHVRLLKEHCIPNSEIIGKSVTFWAIPESDTDHYVSFRKCTVVKSRKRNGELEVFVDVSRNDELDVLVNEDLGFIEDKDLILAKDQTSVWIKKSSTTPLAHWELADLQGEYVEEPPAVQKVNGDVEAEVKEPSTKKKKSKKSKKAKTEKKSFLKSLNCFTKNN